MILTRSLGATFETRTAMATTAATNLIGALLNEPMPAELK